MWHNRFYLPLQKPKLSDTERRLAGWSNRVEVKLYKIWLLEELGIYLFKK